MAVPKSHSEGSSSARSRHKRRRTESSPPTESHNKVTKTTSDTIDTVSKPPLEKAAVPHTARGHESRLKRFRSRATKSFQDRLERALSQRYVSTLFLFKFHYKDDRRATDTFFSMFIIDRVRHEADDSPEEVFEIAGSTGNVYTVKINRQPTCTCPDSSKGNQCKHIVYVRWIRNSW